MVREHEDKAWGDWIEYRRMILSELERLVKDMRGLNEKVERFRQEDVAQMKTDIVLLKFQAAIWGAVAGLLATGTITLAIKFIRF